MFTFLMVTHIFVSIVLILVILMQAGRGGGVSEIFGGASSKTIFGTSATQFLMKATAVCAVLFIITSLSLAILSARRSRSLMAGHQAAPPAVNAVDIGGEESMPAQTDIPDENEEKTPESNPE